MKTPALFGFIFCVFSLMDANAPGFNDPQFVFYGHGFKCLQELPDQLFEERQGRIMGDPDNDNAAALPRGKPQHIGEVQVECYQTPLFGATNFVKPHVRTALKMLVPDSQNVMTVQPKNLPGPRPEIFIQLKFHPAATSTKRSRDISAP